VNRLLALEAFKQVTAPFAGRITARQIDVGSLVNVGSGSPGTPLYTVAQTNPLNIFANVPQSDAPSVHEGLKVRLLVEEYPTRNFEATVVRTADALDPASRTLNTEMQIANDDGALFSGMYAQLEFTLRDAGSPIVIPASAFVFGADGSKVATLTKDSRVHGKRLQSAAISALKLR
jgi:membrane fusion protein (multidrug efflux system)